MPPHGSNSTFLGMILKTIGSLLFAGALVAAMVMQVSGRGLVTTRPATVPPSVTPGPPGTTMVVTTGPSTVFHLKRIGSVAGVAALGLVCFFLSGRDE